MSERIGRAIRRSGLAGAIAPPEHLRRQQQTDRILTADGELEAWATRRVRTPFRFDWDVAGALAVGAIAAVRECPRSGSVGRVAAHVGTAPSTSLIIQLTAETAGSDPTPIVTVTIYAGETTGLSEVAEPVTVGTWLGLAIDQAGGAADLSVTATVATGG